MPENERKLDYRDPEWLADQLGVDKSTIYRYLQEGALPGLQLGRKWLVSERQVLEFLDAEARRQTDVRRKGLAPKPDRFEKFTEKAQRALTYAQEEALAFHHNYIGTEHLLLGLIRVTDAVADRALANLGVELETVRATVLNIIGRGPTKQVQGAIGLTPRAKKVIDLAVDEARTLNHSYVGTEHLLLGLLREGKGIAAGILKTMGVTSEDARREIARLLVAGPDPAGPAGPVEPGTA